MDRTSWSTNIQMILFYLSIPLMVMAVAIAVVPLIVAMRLQHQSEQQATEVAEDRLCVEESLAFTEDPIAA